MEQINTIGRRKASVARVYVTSGSGNITINGKDYKTENGASTFSPSLIGNHIDIFTKYYREKNGIPLNKKKLVGNSN